MIVGVGLVLDLAEAINTATQTACLAASGGLALTAFWTGPLGLAAAGYLLSACSALETGSFVVDLLVSYFPRMREDLVLTPTLMQGVTPITYSISVQAPFERGVICGYALGGIAELVQSLILKRLTSRLTVLGSYKILQHIPFDQRDGFLRQFLVDIVREFIEALKTSVGFALDSFGLTQKLEDLKTQICRAIGSESAFTISPVELRPAEVVPLHGGVISTDGGGILLQFVCGSAGVTSVQVRGSLPVVGSTPFRGSTLVTCLPIAGSWFAETYSLTGGDCLDENLALCATAFELGIREDGVAATSSFQAEF